MPNIDTTLIITPEHPRRIDRVVQQMTGGYSRAKVRGLFDHDCVSLNGQTCPQPQTELVDGDTVRLVYDPHRGYSEKQRPWADPAYVMVYEDEHIMVVDKAAHVLTVPTDKDEPNALVDALKRYLNRGPVGKHIAHVVHRLDRGTSGLLVFGKTPEAGRNLREQFAAHKPEREYEAIVVGHLPQAEGTFDSYLSTGFTLNRYSTPNPNAGERAITHFRVISELRDTTHVAVRLETGQRNQIRVHFAEAGYPVMGDKRYKPRRARHYLWTAPRLALHARLLIFEHPVTHEVMRFESPLPREFVKFLKS